MMSKVLSLIFFSKDLSLGILYY